MDKSIGVRGLDFTGYMVKDPQRAIAFYRDVLGLEPARVYRNGRGAEYDLADGSTFGLWGAGNPRFAFQPSNSALLHVDDLDVAVQVLKEKGVAFEDMPLPSCRMVFFSDSEGNTVFLHRRNE